MPTSNSSISPSTTRASTGPTPYDALADEYYDPIRHPTCAAFRDASIHLLRRAFGALGGVGEILDVGCGRSVLCELHEAVRCEHITALDDSAKMLEHSRACFGDRGSLVHASAVETGLKSESFDVVVASAGDPYNVPAFWRECRRLLKPDGRVFFTTPSNVWATRFRRTEGTAAHIAAFFLADGTQIDTPSFVFPESEQIEMMEGAGLRARLLDRETLEELEARGVVAPKLNAVMPNEAIFSLYEGARGA